MPAAPEDPRGRPAPGRFSVRFGTAELMEDLDRPSGRLVAVDGVPQSYVDLDDPTYLDFEYARLVADVVECGFDPRVPLAVVHCGGAALTLARYVAATRAGSRQLVLDPDRALVEVVRHALGVRRPRGCRVRAVDAREGVARLRAGVADVVVNDTFVGSAIPTHLTTVEFVRDVARVLRPGGVYVLNVADSSPFGFGRRVAATLVTCFDEVVLLAEPGVLRGRRFGNLVVAASPRPLPVEALSRRAASAVPRARLLDTDGVAAFAGGAAPLTDATPVPSPTPPPDELGFGRPPTEP